jgi:hypothetical protein
VLCTYSQRNSLGGGTRSVLSCDRSVGADACGGPPRHHPRPAGHVQHALPEAEACGLEEILRQRRRDGRDEVPLVVLGRVPRMLLSERFQRHRSLLPLSSRREAPRGNARKRAESRIVRSCSSRASRASDRHASACTRATAWTHSREAGRRSCRQGR